MRNRPYPVLKCSSSPALGVRLPTALQVLQTLSHNTRRQTGAHWLKEIKQTTQVADGDYRGLGVGRREVGIQR